MDNNKKTNELVSERKNKPLDRVHEFKAKIRQECDRSDRYGMRLSLIIYEVGSNEERSSFVSNLVRTLCQRLRSTDHIGWFDSAKIGILLPHTPPDGVCKVCEDLSQLAHSLPSMPPFSLFTYPSDMWPSHIGNQWLRLSKLLSFLNIFTNRQAIPGCEEFRTHLKLEVDRTIRYGHIFTFLIFEDQRGNKKNTLHKVAKALNSRLRENDIFGMYQANSIGVILPYTAHSDGSMVGEEICARAGLENCRDIQLSVYPSSWFNDTGALVSEIPTIESVENESRDEPKDFSNSRRNSDVVLAESKGRDDGLQPPLNPGEVGHILAKQIPGWKRVLDFFGGAIILIVFMPFFLVAAIGIKLTSPGPIFFQQERIGYKGKPFQLLKFRSMHADSDTDRHRKYMKMMIGRDDEQGETKLKQDPRIFPFGRILRKTSIDEMPQLINVLRGEMSLVGPRPCLDYEAEEYLRWHAKRFYVMPGLTGLWQVSGKNRLSFKQMIRLDIQYQNKMSFLFDMYILCKTPFAVFSIFFDKQTT